MKRDEPAVTRESTVMHTVTGSFYRAVDPAYPYAALAGSRSAGRYSPPDVPTLYLSSSPEGVAAAMIAHVGDRTPDLEVLRFEVKAHRIVDLRDREASKSVGVNPADAAAEWQQAVGAGVVPSSWKVREALERMGAQGLIDPSRKQPGLWHLTLFDWNTEGAPSVRQVAAREGWR